MKMKKLILLSLTLGLTFPAAHMLAGGWLSRPVGHEVLVRENEIEEQEQKVSQYDSSKLSPFDYLPDEMLVNVCSYLELGSKDFYNAALTDKRFTCIIGSLLTPKEKETIQRYQNKLREIESIWEQSTHPRFCNLVKDFLSCEIFNMDLKLASIISKMFNKFAQKYNVNFSIFVGSPEPELRYYYERTKGSLPFPITVRDREQLQLLYHPVKIECTFHLYNVFNFIETSGSWLFVSTYKKSNSNNNNQN